MMNGIKNISDLPKHVFDEMMHFFNVYKTLEGKVVVVKHVLDANEAKNVIENSIKRYEEKFHK